MTQIQGSTSSTGTSSTSSSSSSSSSTGKAGKGLDGLDLSQFLNLIVTELQNQDPLSPTDNAALMQQIGQLRELSANDKLTTTLTSFSITQELTTASSLIGKTVDGIDDTGGNVKGVVDSVTVKIDEKDKNNRQVRVQVGGKTVDIKNVREIDATTSTTTPTTPTSTTPPATTTT